MVLCLLSQTHFHAERMYNEEELGEGVSDFVSKNIFTNYASGLEGGRKGQWNAPSPSYSHFCSSSFTWPTTSLLQLREVVSFSLTYWNHLGG